MWENKMTFLEKQVLKKDKVKLFFQKSAKIIKISTSNLISLNFSDLEKVLTVI